MENNNHESVEKLKEEIYRYKTLYEIYVEENDSLKEQNRVLQALNQENSQGNGSNKKTIGSAFYNVARKVYRKIRKR